MMERPYYIDYQPIRLVIHKLVTSKYFDLAISAVIGVNVITMAMEFYMMPAVSEDNLRGCYCIYCIFSLLSLLCKFAITSSLESLSVRLV